MPISTIFLPLKISAVVRGCGPSAVITRNVASGTLSPTLIVIAFSLTGSMNYLSRASYPIQARRLVERRLNLDCLASRDQREEELSRNGRATGRRTVDDEPEAELAAFRFDLFGKRQRPAVVRPLGQKIGRT